MVFVLFFKSDFIVLPTVHAFISGLIQLPCCKPLDLQSHEDLFVYLTPDLQSFLPSGSQPAVSLLKDKHGEHILHNTTKPVCHRN